MISLTSSQNTERMQRNEERKTDQDSMDHYLSSAISDIVGSLVRELLLGGEAMAHLPEQDTNIRILFGHNFIINNPCKDCTDREVGCHGKCDRYATYRKELDQSKAIRNKYSERRIKNGGY